MIMKRDQEVIEFLSKFKIATTGTITELFYPSLRVAQKRLKELYESKYLDRDRNHFTNEFNYYIKGQKPKQDRHRLLLTDFYREFHKFSKIIKFENEVAFENLRADGFVAYQYRCRNYIAFIEVEISNKGLDTDKYKKLYLSEVYKRYFPVFPLVIVISNKKIQQQNYFKIVQIREDMSNIKDIFINS